MLLQYLLGTNIQKSLALIIIYSNVNEHISRIGCNCLTFQFIAVATGKLIQSATMGHLPKEIKPYPLCLATIKQKMVLVIHKFLKKQQNLPNPME